MAECLPYPHLQRRQGVAHRDDSTAEPVPTPAAGHTAAPQKLPGSPRQPQETQTHPRNCWGPLACPPGGAAILGPATEDVSSKPGLPERRTVRRGGRRVGWCGGRTAQSRGRLVGSGRPGTPLPSGHLNRALRERRREPHDHLGRRVPEAPGVKSRGSTGLSQSHVGSAASLSISYRSQWAHWLLYLGPQGQFLGCRCLDD